jgi:hypothetical protein
MGSYAECWLGRFYVGSTKNDVHPDLIGLFRSTDKHVVRGRKHSMPFPMRHWLNTIEADEDVTTVFYRAPVQIVRDRLELKGYTLDEAKSAFKVSCRTHSEHYEGYDPPMKEHFAARAETLRTIEPDDWIERLRAIRTENVDKPHQELAAQTKSMFDIYESDWYGYEGPDLNVPLRLALEVCEEGDEFVYDLTDIILQEYFSAESDFVANALVPASEFYLSDSKRIILTEGKSDTWIISESLKLLYPHLADYFAFMDFDVAKVGGGAGNLANIVKAFAGAGILNRVVAVFDNDTAAETAIRSLRDVRLPDHIQVMKLPDLPVLQKYPTIGPAGPAPMNVNGMAASIELYLGADSLSDEQGELTPIQWTGYESGVGKYQGEVQSKDRIHERFRRKLDACLSDPSFIKRTDWEGLRIILRAVRDAFHPLDSKRIRELAIQDFSY